MAATASVKAGAQEQNRLPTWWRAVLFGAAYFLLAEASRYLSVHGSTYISFWLPAGLYVAVLPLHERRAWPWLVLAAFAANMAFDLSHGTALFAAVLFSCANMVQAVTGAWLVRRFVSDRPSLASLGEFAGFLGLTAVLGSMAGAAIGAGTLVAFGLSGSFMQSWKVWWGSNAMAILLLSPFILAWFSRSDAILRRQVRPARILEAAVLLLLLAGLTWNMLFASQGIMAPDKGWILLPLLWAGLRFGRLGATAASLLLSLLAAFFTTQFFSGLTPEQIEAGDYVFVLQTSLAMAALAALTPAIAVSERDDRIVALHASEERLRRLSRRLIEVEETERRSINRELHDRVGQNLSALNLNVEIVRGLLPGEALQKVGARLDDARTLLEETLGQVRNLMAELRPAALDDYGLLAALRHHAAAVAARLGIPIVVEGKDPEPRMPLTTEIALFRIAQEALNNVAKHARARAVTVTLTATPRGVKLTVADDGVGFDAGRVSPGAPTYGIVTMRERAETIGASLHIESASGKGTRIAVETSSSGA